MRRIGLELIRAHSEDAPRFCPSTAFSDSLRRKLCRNPKADAEAA